MGVETDKKERIRLAAIAVLGAKGYHESTVALIAERAGVAVGTIYNYFEDKPDILRHIFETEFRRRRALFDALMEDPEGRPLERIEAILQYHLQAVSENPDLARVILAERSILREDCSFVSKRTRGLPGMLSRILEDGLRRGLLRPHRPEILAQCLMGAIEGAMAGYAEAGERPGAYHAMAEAQRITDELMALLRGGIVHIETSEGVLP